jgi:hypothetical protein
LIVLAHTVGGAGGPEIEILLLGGAAIVTAVLLFFQKNVHRAAPPVVLLIGIAAVVGAFAINTGSDAGATRVTIVDPKPGDEVEAGEPVELEIAVTGQPEGSHVHVFVDGELEQMPSGLTAAIILERGRHEVSVELTDVDHGSFEPRITDTIELVAR